MITDAMGAVISFLEADAAVAALVDGGIFGVELPRTEVPNMPRKNIVIQSSGGGGFTADYLDVSPLLFDAFCYGQTHFQADRLRREVYQSLKRMRRNVTNSVLLHWIQPAGGFLTLRDPDAGWPIAFQSFQLLFSEVGVT